MFTRPNSLSRAVFSALAAALALACVAVACSPSAAPPATTTTTTTTTPAPNLFCTIWEQRNTKGADGQLPKPPYAYELEPGTVVHARETSQVGGDCEDPAARIDMFQGEIIGKDVFYRPHNSLDGPQLPTQAYSQTLAAGQPQAPSIEITSLNISLSFRGIRIWGTLRITVNGAASTVNFDGTYQNLQNFSVSVVAPALNLPGFASHPISASGSFKRTNGLNDIKFDATVPDLQVGDIRVEGVDLHLHAATTTGLTALIKGTVKAGGSNVAVDISAAFDSRGVLSHIDGSLDLAVSAIQPNGQPISLAGHLSLSGESAHIEASFAGTGRVGADSFARVAGSVEIDGAGVVTFDGLFDVAFGGSSLSLQGTVVFDGSSGYPSLTATAAGAYHGSTDRGELVEVSGIVKVTNTGGVITTTVDGALRIGTLRGSAHAIVHVNGSTTTLDITGEVTTSPLDAAVSGSVVFSGGAVQSLLLSGNLLAAAQVGDLTVTGSIDISGGRSGYSARVGGSFNGPGTLVTGSAALVLDGNGDLVSLQADVSGRIFQAGWSVTGFRGTMTADDNTAVLRGSGAVAGSGVNYGSAQGTLVVTGGTSTLNLWGQAMVTSGSKSVFGDFMILNNQLRMALVNVVYPPILIDPERVWVAFVMVPGATCTQIAILDATFLIGLFTGGQVAAHDLNCPIP